jgi:outer membrane protein assembly factor BamB
MKRCLGLVTLLLGTSIATAGDNACWPQWRGPTRDGQISGPPWPATIKGDALKPMWRVKLGPSYSGPIVAEDRVFVTETIGEKEEVVTALDRATGRELWKVRWAGAMRVPFFARSNGDWIRATPAYDGKNLYVAGMRDVLVCLDAETGAEKWRVDFVKQFGAPVPAFGFVSSPLVVGDGVYVQAGAAVVKVDRESGSIRWQSLKDDGGMYGSAFSSPAFAEIAGRPQVLVQTRTTLAGLNPIDGAVIWKQEIPAFRGMNILTPTVFDGGLFTSAYGGKTHFFRLIESDGKLNVTETWTHRAQANMSTPVVVNGHAFLHLRNQRVMCFDLKTGKEAWTSSKLYGKYWSLVANGDRILALDERGILYLLKANTAEMQVLDERKISDAETWAHLAVCGDELFIRDLGGLTVYRWQDLK